MSGYDGGAIDLFDFHHSMLVDEGRTAAFRNAITTSITPGDVVVDVGSGTGVLALFAAKAGAARVYAIEREPIIEVAREIAECNGLSETIIFVEGSSLDVELPERADVLVTETIGNIGLDEGIITFVEDARRRFLKPDAAVIPRNVDVVASLVSVPRDFRAIDRWSQPLSTLDFSPLSRIVRNNVAWIDLSPAALVTPPHIVFGTDFSGQVSTLSASVRSVALKDAIVHGIGSWFRSNLTNDIHVTNEPSNAVPSWENGFLPLGEPIEVRSGDRIEFEVSSSISGDEWTWRVGAGRSYCTSDGRLGVHETA